MMQKFVSGLLKFRDDTRAVVAIQVTIFSVMLMTASGLVIDFGRAYSAHSQMQSFVDKAALAAANELDLRPDAIARATAAANAVAQASPFTEAGSFSIRDIKFLSSAPSDRTGAFNYSLISDLGLETDIGNKAHYVLVIAEPTSVRLTLLSLNIGGQEREMDDIPLATFAVATLESSTCGGISTMVMCNPFEGSDKSFAEEMDGIAGAHMMLRVDTDLGGAPRLQAEDNMIRLGLLKNPHTEIGADPEQICSGANLELFAGAAFTGAAAGPGNPGNGKAVGNAGENPNGQGGWGGGSVGRSDANGEEGAEPIELVADPWTYPTTEAGLEELRDACLLAMIDSGLQCIGDELLVKAAAPGTITTGLNTIFDLWDAPLDRVLTTDGLQEHFSPDLVVAHGMLTREDYGAYLEEFYMVDTTETQATLLELLDMYYGLQAANPAMAPFYQTFIDNLTVAYEAAVSANDTVQNTIDAYAPNVANPASRVNHIFMGAGNGWGPYYRGLCLRDPESCIFAPYIDAPGGAVTGDDEAVFMMTGATEWTTGSLNLTSLGATESGNASGWRLSNPTDDDLAVSLSFFGGDGPWVMTVPARSRVSTQVPSMGTMVATFQDAATTSLTKETCPFAQCGYSGLEPPTYEVDAPTTLAAYQEWFATYYTPYVNENDMDFSGGVSEMEQLVEAAGNMYEGYSTVERIYSDLWPAAASNGPWPDGVGIQTEPVYYSFGDADPSAVQTSERRRQRVTVINCGDMTAYSDFAGEVVSGFEDTYLAEAVDVVDIFLTEAVEVDACLPGTTGADPQERNDCWNSDITAVNIYAEFISSAEQTVPSGTTHRGFATLVH